MSAGTTLRSVRVDDDLWREAQAQAFLCDETVSDVIRRALAHYVATEGQGI